MNDKNKSARLIQTVRSRVCVCPFWPLSVFRLTTMAAAPPLTRSDSARGEFSPLKHFVVAKKTISDVFEQLLNYVKETSDFVEGEVFCVESVHQLAMAPFHMSSLCVIYHPSVISLWLMVSVLFWGQKPVGIKRWRTSPARIRSWRFSRMLINLLSLRKCWHADTWKWPFLAGKYIH